ncbi:MAG: hypothetical protein EAZ21_06905 [Betaproteobacteria bacterium]|nr:MAG: hypothetical protein EAZ21_06905 [Betaproteobacteria bacterium]
MAFFKACKAWGMFHSLEMTISLVATTRFGRRTFAPHRTAPVAEFASLDAVPPLLSRWAMEF